MLLFEEVVEQLARLEKIQFERISNSYRYPDDLSQFIRGSVQSYVANKPKSKKAVSLPVVCAVGINYTQDGRCDPERVFPYEQASVGVVRSTGSTAAVASVLAAYGRNRDIWISRPSVDPKSPMSYYGSPLATERTGVLTNGDFILVMTNHCPFITVMEWARQPQDISTRLIQESAAYSILDDLYDAIGDSIDLWIGHSALGGTQWVWPEFASFVQRRHIKEWLLTQNISPRSHLWFEGIFREPSHRLFPWYGLERKPRG